METVQYNLSSFSIAEIGLKSRLTALQDLIDHFGQSSQALLGAIDGSVSVSVENCAKALMLQLISVENALELLCSDMVNSSDLMVQADQKAARNIQDTVLPS